MSSTAGAPPALTTAEVRRLLEERSIRPRKSQGQNFVADPNTIARIVRLAGVRPGDRVVEVGPGLGALTAGLAAAGASVLAIEIDPRLAAITSERTAGLAVEVVTKDALVVEWSELLARPRGATGGSDGAPWSLVANLPYNVAVPLVVKVLEEVPPVESLLVMLQREVGERLVANPGTEAFGAVSLKVAYWAEASIVGKVPASVFVPRPRVSSVLVRLVRRIAPAVDPAEVSYERLFHVVQAGFAQRRKMLRRALRGVVDPEAFSAAGVSGDLRAEQLGLDAWLRLAAHR